MALDLKRARTACTAGRMTPKDGSMQTQDIPQGYCQCGCGAQVRNRYLPGHCNRGRVQYLVDEQTGCWNWQLYVDDRGYGRCKKDRAHREYYRRHVGPIPEGTELDHLCRNKRCVNPDHLEPVTHAENVRRGQRAKLSRADVQMVRESKETGAELARMLGVTKEAIYAIRKGKTWSDG